MSTTVLPRITSSHKAERHWTPGPAYLPGTSQRDPIVGTVRPYHKDQHRSPSREKTLPDIYQRNFNKNARYESRIVILIDRKTGKKIKLPEMAPEGDDKQLRVAKSTYHSNVHQRSVFENTRYSSSFFIIHPDWTSEPQGRSRVSCKERSHYSWDGRPAVHPLSGYIEPLMEKRRVRDQYMKAMEQDKKIEAAFSRAQSRTQASARMLKPQTPKDPQGHYKGFSMY